MPNKPISKIDPNGLSYLIYDQGTKTLYLYSGQGEILGTFDAGNNVVKSVGTSPLKEGNVYDFAYQKNHPADPNGPFGSNGNFVFNVPGHQGVGVHAGRANKGGPTHPTEGCIRTTDDATDLISRTHADDPLTSLTIINSK